ncbi:MAG: methyltransferase domain-containing protein [Sphaerochaetaceae bacterium]
MSTGRKMKKVFFWNPQAITLKAFCTGVGVVVLSFLMIPLSEENPVGIIIRDVLMILVAGLFYPLSCMKDEGNWEEFGLTTKRWYLFLLGNLLLSLMLVAVFMKKSPLPSDFRFVAHWKEILYILLAGVFECIVFYSFIRTAFSRSFGPVVGVVVTAIFYSLHHAGFQPEFGKLFFVGLLYAVFVAMTNNILVIFPFFWGVGAAWDVLVQSEAVSSIAYPLQRSLFLVSGMILIVTIIRSSTRENRIPEGGAILDKEGLTAEEYGQRMYLHLATEYQRFARDAAFSLSLPAKARILELGPGPGWAGLELLKLKNDMTLIAIEASPDMIRAAQKNAKKEGLQKRTEYLQGFAEDLSRFAAASFDAVISRDSLHHWDDPSSVFMNIDRVLKPTGRVFIVDSKRNLTLVEQMVVRLACMHLGPSMAQAWRNSIRASWTSRELRTLFRESDLSQWTVSSHFLDLVIERKVD